MHAAAEREDRHAARPRRRQGLDAASAGKASTSRCRDGNWPLISASAAAVPGRRQPAAAGDDARRHGPRARRLRARGRDARPRPASTGSSCTARTATCCRAFISPLTNQRTDDYGGSLENRLRYPLEVFARGARVWPARQPMSVRISAHDWVDRRHHARRRGRDRARSSRPPAPTLIDCLVRPGHAGRQSRSTAACSRRRSPTASATRPASRPWRSARSPRPTTSTASSPRAAPTCARWRGRTSPIPSWTLHEAAQIGYRDMRVAGAVSRRPRRSSSATRARARAAAANAALEQANDAASYDRRASMRLVTGGGRGIGAAIARALAGAGRARHAAGPRRERLERCAESSRQRRICVHRRRRRRDEASRCASPSRSAAQALGPVDILVNNAGQAESAPFAQDRARRCGSGCSTSTSPARFCARRRRWPTCSSAGTGRIVNIASTAGLKGYAYVAAYCAAKHGVIGLTRALALEVARNGHHRQRRLPRLHRDRHASAQLSRNIVAKTGRSDEEARAEPASAAIRRAASCSPRKSPTRCCGCAAGLRRRSPGRRSRSRAEK